MILVIVPRSNVELNAKTALTELRGLLSGNTAEFGQFLILKSEEWNMPAKVLLGQFEKLGAEFSNKKDAGKELYVGVKKYLDNPVSANSAHTEMLSSEDAEKLVSIIAKYIDLDTIGELTGKEFALQLFNKMDLDEIVVIEKLLLGDDFSETPTSEIMNLCIKAMIRNNLLSLLKVYNTGGNNGI